MFTLATVFLLALSRAELLERFRAPVVTQADGLVKVYAECPEDMRRDFQAPVGDFAARLVRQLYRAQSKKETRFDRPGIILTLGDVRTNLTAVLTRVSTNHDQVVTRILLPAPGHADIDRLRLAIVKAFFRSVEGRELADAEARTAYRRADPALRIADERGKLSAWLAGKGTRDDEAGLKLLHRIFEPGKASRLDVLIFASRLYLYPPYADQRFLGRYASLSFAEALHLAREDLATRLMALEKAKTLPVWGGGKSRELFDAANAYQSFLNEFARAELSERELAGLLDAADTKLNIAFERAL